MKLSIITRAGPGLVTTARSLSIQRDAPHFEWFIIGDTTDPRLADTGVAFTPAASRADAVSLASGHYICFLDAPSCLADLYVLRDIASALRMGLAPQFLFADARLDGHIIRARDTDRLPYGPITAMGAQIFDKKILTHDVVCRFEQDDYALTLHATATATRAHYLSRIVCDAPDTVPDAAALFRTRENGFVSKPVSRVLYWRDHITACVKTRYPHLYWRLRHVFIPPYRRQSVAEFRRHNPAFNP
jgi:hypothetical protein